MSDIRKCNKVIRILVSGFTSNYGGVETFLFQHFKYMNHDNIQMDFLTHVKQPAFHKEIEAMGGKFFYIPVRNKYPLKYRKALKMFFKNHAKQYDVFWCNKCMLNNIDFLRYAKKYDIPIRILHSHNSSNMDTGVKGRLMESLHRYNKNKIMSYVTDFWTCSDYAASWMFPLEVLKKKLYTFIPNAVDANKFRINEEVRMRIREEFDMDGKFVIGHIGRFNYQKNHEFLIQIFKNLYDQDPDVRLLLVGCGELEESVRQQVKALNLEGVVKFLGIRHDIPDIMQGMDCFVLPSRFEGLPVVAIEAQAAGLPCILSKEKITEQVKVTHNVEFVSLSQPANEWAKIILCQKDRREDSYEAIKNQGFSIDTAVNKIEGLLENYIAREIEI